MPPTTLADFAAEYLTVARLKPSTRRDYSYVLKSHVLPRLGKRELASITTADVLRLQTAMASIQLGPTKRSTSSAGCCGLHGGWGTRPGWWSALGPSPIAAVTAT
jgi:hypothetical protein